MHCFSHIVFIFVNILVNNPSVGGTTGFKRSLPKFKGYTIFSWRRSDLKTHWGGKDRLTLVLLCRTEKEGVGLSMEPQAENNTIFESTTDCCCYKIEQYHSTPLWLLCGFTEQQMPRTLPAQLSCSKPLMSFIASRWLGYTLKHASASRHLLLNYKLFIFISAPGDLRALSWRLAVVKRGRPVLPWNEYEKQLGLSSLTLWHVLLRENRWPRRRNVC